MEEEAHDNPIEEQSVDEFVSEAVSDLDVESFPQDDASLYEGDGAAEPEEGDAGEPQDAPEPAAAEISEDVLRAIGFQNRDEMEAIIAAGRENSYYQRMIDQKSDELSAKEKELAEREQLFEQTYFADPEGTARRFKLLQARYGYQKEAPPEDDEEIGSFLDDDLDSDEAPPGKRPRTTAVEQQLQKISRELREIKQRDQQRLEAERRRQQEAVHEGKQRVAAAAIHEVIKASPELANLSDWLHDSVMRDISVQERRPGAPDPASMTAEQYLRTIALPIVQKQAARMRAALHRTSASTAEQAESVQRRFPAATPRGGATMRPGESQRGPARVEADVPVEEFVRELLESERARAASRSGTLPMR